MISHSRTSLARIAVLSGLFHKYDTFVAPNLACGKARGKERIRSGSRNRRATQPQAKFGATLRAAVLFGQTSLLAPYRSTAGYARRSRLIRFPELFIRRRGEPGKSSPQPVVNNSAAPEMKSGEKVLRSRHSCPGRIALGGSRSFVSHPTRINEVHRPARRRPSQRLREQQPTRLLVSGRRMTAPRCNNQKANSYENMERHHALRRLRLGQRSPRCSHRGSRRAESWRTSNSITRWKAGRASPKKPPPGPTWRWPSKPARELRSISSCNANYTVYPVHPVAAQSYRERKAPSGTKTDHVDAWGLADALRVDGHGLESAAAHGSTDPTVAPALPG